MIAADERRTGFEAPDPAYVGFLFPCYSDPEFERE